MKTLLKMKEARAYAARINAECSGCFSDAKAAKEFGQWVVKIGGGSGCCYGRTIETVEAAEDTLRVFRD